MDKPNLSEWFAKHDSLIRALLRVGVHGSFIVIASVVCMDHLLALFMLFGITFELAAYECRKNLCKMRSLCYLACLFLMLLAGINLVGHAQKCQGCYREPVAGKCKCILK